MLYHKREIRDRAAKSLGYPDWKTLRAKYAGDFTPYWKLCPKNSRKLQCAKRCGDRTIRNAFSAAHMADFEEFQSAMRGSEYKKSHNFKWLM